MTVLIKNSVSSSDPNASLWARLQAIDFDDAQAQFNFTQRLARDNDWSQDFARRTIEEYRRFVYLAMTAGHEVTPSDEVDQVWHLHLTYTHHYWGPFTEILGAPLHHGPTAGGATERMRYADNYDRTRASYQRVFGDKPPIGIWPPSKERFGNAPFMRRINILQQAGSKNIAMWKARIAGFAGVFIGILAGVTGTVASASSSENGGLTSIMQSLGVSPKELFIVVAIIVVALVLMMLAAKKNSKSKSDKGAGAVFWGGHDGSSSGGDGGSGCSGGGGCGGGCGG